MSVSFRIPPLAALWKFLGMWQAKVLAVLVLASFFSGQLLADEMVTSRMSFAVEGHELSARLDVPAEGEARGLVIFVHGYGDTDIFKRDSYRDLRTKFAKIGIASFTWDKPGCGDSEGTFDIDQPVEQSADGVVAAAQYLRDQKVPGSDFLGIWGVSRGGWIAPLAISKDRQFAFWISVSGVDANETFGYLLQENWRILGYEQSRISALYEQWKTSFQLVANGTAYSDFVAATRDYFDDPFVQKMTGQKGVPSRLSYWAWVADYRANPPTFDPETGLIVTVDKFDQLLSSLDLPVLAIFGEKDTNVDWRKTRDLYQATIGQKNSSLLTIRQFPDGNHNLHKSETGGFDEMIANLKTRQYVDGYITTIVTWVDNLAPPSPQ